LKQFVKLARICPEDPWTRRINDIDPPELIGEALLSCLLFAGARMLDRNWRLWREKALQRPVLNSMTIIFITVVFF
jgi:hypothetical protein